MPFHRFEQFESRLLTPHLSTGAAAVIERMRCGPGEIAHMPRGCSRTLTAAGASNRFAAVCSAAWLEQKIDTMTPEEQARARVERKAN